MVITTGNGKVFKPNWLNAVKSIEYNVTEFDFVNITGSLVHRARPRGRKFDIEIFFQGKDHLDTSLNFEISANDPRSWTIEHPFYGFLIVQPLGLSFDNTKYNVSRVTGSLIETITEDKPRTTLSPADRIAELKTLSEDSFSNSFGLEKIKTPDIVLMQGNTNKIYADGKKVAKDSLDVEAYFNSFNEAQSAILNATAQPLEAMRKIQAMINYPGQFIETVRNRINALKIQFNILKQSVSTLNGRSQKKVYEATSSTLISTACIASATPQLNDYGNRSDVVAIMETVLSIYKSFIEDLDALQTDNGGLTDSYIPDFESLQKLNELVNYTVSALFEIAINSKQERSVIIEDDSNLVLLAHRFYGLRTDDSTLEELMRNNNIGINELLKIDKGRKIIYYV